MVMVNYCIYYYQVLILQLSLSFIFLKQFTVQETSTGCMNYQEETVRVSSKSQVILQKQRKIMSKQTGNGGCSEVVSIP